MCVQRILQLYPISVKYYKIAVHYGLYASQMDHISCILQTSGRPDMLQNDVIEHGWSPMMRYFDRSRLKRMMSLNVKVLRTAALHVWSEVRCISVMLRLVSNLAVSVLLRTWTIYKSIEGIFSSGNIEFPFNSTSVSNVIEQRAGNCKTEMRRDGMVTNIMSEQYCSQELVRVT